MARMMQLKEQAVADVKQFAREMVQLRETTDTVSVGSLMAMMRQKGESGFLEMAIYQLVKDGVFEPFVRTSHKITHEVVYLTPAFRREVLGGENEKDKL